MKKILIILTHIFISSITYAQLDYPKDHIFLLDVSGSMDEETPFEEVKGLIKNYVINDALFNSGDRIVIRTFCELKGSDETVSDVIFDGNYRDLNSLKTMIDENLEVTYNDTNLVNAVKLVGIKAGEELKTTNSSPRLTILWLFTDNRHHLEEGERIKTRDFYYYLDEEQTLKKIYFFPIIPEKASHGFILYAILFSPIESSKEIACFDTYINSVSKNTNLQSVLYKPINSDILKIIFKGVEIKDRALVVKGLKANEEIKKEVKFKLKSKFEGWIVKNAQAKMEILNMKADGFVLPEFEHVKRILIPDVVRDFGPLEEEEYRLQITVPPVKSIYSLDSVINNEGIMRANMAFKVSDAQLVPACEGAIAGKIYELESMVRPVPSLPPAKMAFNFVINYPGYYFWGTILGSLILLLLFLLFIFLAFLFFKKQLHQCLLTTPEGDVSFSLSPLRGHSVNSANKNLGKIRMGLFGDIKFFPVKGVTIDGKPKSKRLRKGGDSIELNINEKIIPIYFEVQREIDTILSPVSGEEDIH